MSVRHFDLLYRTAVYVLRHFARSTDGHERFKEFISGHMTSETSCVLVAEQDGKAVGYCLATLAKYPQVFKNRGSSILP